MDPVRGEELWKVPSGDVQRRAQPDQQLAVGQPAYPERDDRVGRDEAEGEPEEGAIEEVGESVVAEVALDLVVEAALCHLSGHARLRRLIRMVWRA